MAANIEETKIERLKLEKFHDFFKNENVGNLHVFASQTASPNAEYFFYGEPIPRGYFDLIDPSWRSLFSNDLKAFAVTTLKGTVRENPFYIIRFEQSGVQNSIDLFELENGLLQHKQRLATYWCKEKLCLQQDSWVQDLDGDTQFDIIKKIRIVETQSDGTETKEEYHVVYGQKPDGTFLPSNKFTVDEERYFMNK